MSPLDIGSWPTLRDALIEGFATHVRPDQIDRLFQGAQPPERAARTLAEARVGRRADEPVRDQLAFALEIAQAGGFLPDFAFALGNQMPAPQEAILHIQRLFDPAVPADAVKFEALASILLGFDHPGEVVYGMHRGRLNTCIVEVNGAAGQLSGTGFLLRTDLVLTSFHTFNGSGFILPGPGTTARDRFKAAEGVRGQISIVFNNFRNPVLGDRLAGRGTPVELAPDWLVAASDSSAIGPKNLDYVLIKLASCPPTLPGGMPRAPDDFPADETQKAKVYLFQHPKGSQIRVAHGAFRVRAATLSRDGLDVNALGGTSGGPYTDRNFRVFALHQGAVSDRTLVPELGDAVNVAVPLSCILADIGPWPPLGVRPRAFVATGPFGRQPLIGRRATCDFVVRALQADGPRTLILQSGTGARGLGLSFTANILAALLPEDEHMLLRLGAEHAWHTMDPRQFCETLIGGPAPLRTLAEAATSQDRWLAGPLLDDLRTAMRARLASAGTGGGRIFWLILDDLDRIEITEGTGLRPFLVELYREAARSDWLRVVLLGYRGPQLEPATYRSETEELFPLGPDIIEDYLDDLDAYLETPVEAGAKLNREIATKAMKAVLLFPEARSETEAIARFLRMFAEKLLPTRRG
ncbi:trypsin-like peptidase domain-containing protein [Paracoccaceae bacterium Fryx2]|nr:trypsin-like peptidase domain-containing protein [Paracoccaceae bacterium Fryx2]